MNIFANNKIKHSNTQQGKNITNYNNNKNNYNLFYWLAGFAFLFSIIALCGVYVYKNVVVVNESIVLIFVGVLATFIVVGNYIQVIIIEKKFDEKIEIIKREFNRKTQEVYRKFNKIEKETQTALDYASKEIENNKNEAIATSLLALGRSLYSTEQYKYTEYSLDCFIKSFSGFNQIKKKNYEKIIDECIEKIYRILSEKVGNLNITPETRKRYLKMLNEIGDSDERKEIIISYIKNIPNNE